MVFNFGKILDEYNQMYLHVTIPAQAVALFQDRVKNKDEILDAHKSLFLEQLDRLMLKLYAQKPDDSRYPVIMEKLHEIRDYAEENDWAERDTYVNLPRLSKELKHASVPTVLHVENEDRWIDMLREMTTSRGAGYIGFKDLDEAVSYIKTHIPNHLPKIVLLDLNLSISIPESHDYDVIRIDEMLEPHNQEVIVRYLTGQEDHKIPDSIIDKCFIKGVSDINGFLDEKLTYNK